jgi:peptidoglycan biosynthesis protein MviN/MurJ (putative lipid II flippase)
MPIFKFLTFLKFWIPHRHTSLLHAPCIMKKLCPTAWTLWIYTVLPLDYMISIVQEDITHVLYKYSSFSHFVVHKKLQQFFLLEMALPSETCLKKKYSFWVSRRQKNCKAKSKTPCIVGFVTLSKKMCLF